MSLGYASLTPQIGAAKECCGCRRNDVSMVRYLNASTLSRTTSCTTHLKNARRADCGLAVRICWYYHHCDYFDLRWVLWNSSGQCSLLAVLLSTRRACPVGVQKPQGPKGTSDEDKDEDESPLRLTAEDAWIFPVVRSFYVTLRACRKK